MKRYLSMALILVMLFSLSACGNSIKQAKACESAVENVQHVAPAEILYTDSDRAEAYEKAIAALDAYLKWGEFFIDENYEKVYESNEALQVLYDMFCALGDYKNSAEIVSRFIIHEDKLVSVSVESIDNLGQSKYPYVESMEYNADGQLIRMSSNDVNYFVREFFYNENGQLTEELEYLNRRNLNCKTVYSYDDRGSIIGISEIYSSTIKDSNWDVFYDDAGRISYSEGYVLFDYYPMGLYYYSNSPQFYYYYSYNDRSELVAVSDNDVYSEHKWVCDYDENGNIIKRAEMKSDETRKTWEYKYDESNRILEFVFRESPTSSYRHIYNFTYGTSYSFNAEGLVL